MISTEMFLNRVEAPELRRRGIYADVVDQFLESENMTLKFNCSNTDEAKRCSQAISIRNREKNQNLTVWTRRCSVYVIKG